MYKMQLTLVMGPLVPHEIYFHGKTREWKYIYLYGQYGNIGKDILCTSRIQGISSYHCSVSDEIAYIPVCVIHCVHCSVDTDHHNVFYIMTYSCLLHAVKVHNVHCTSLKKDYVFMLSVVLSILFMLFVQVKIYFRCHLLVLKWILINMYVFKIIDIIMEL